MDFNVDVALTMVEGVIARWWSEVWLRSMNGYKGENEKKRIRDDKNFFSKFYFSEFF